MSTENLRNAIEIIRMMDRGSGLPLSVRGPLAQAFVAMDKADLLGIMDKSTADAHACLALSIATDFLEAEEAGAMNESRPITGFSASCKFCLGSIDAVPGNLSFRQGTEYIWLCVTCPHCECLSRICVYSNEYDHLVGDCMLQAYAPITHAQNIRIIRE
jgi:hypothetical protein